MTDACRALADEIPLLLDQELSRRRAAQMLGHLAGCARCRSQSQSLAQSWLALDEALPSVSAPAQLRAWRPRTSLWTFESWPVRALVLAAACAALWLVLPPRQQAPVTEQKAATLLLPELKLSRAELAHPPLQGGHSANLRAQPSLTDAAASLSVAPAPGGSRPALAAAPLAGELSGAIPIQPPEKTRPIKQQRRNT